MEIILFIIILVLAFLVFCMGSAIVTQNKRQSRATMVLLHIINGGINVHSDLLYVVELLHGDTELA